MKSARKEMQRTDTKIPDGAASQDAARRRLLADLGHADAIRTIRYRFRAEVAAAADRPDEQGAEP